MKEQIILAGGCFWCTEAVFVRIDGVEASVSGYANGKTDNPTYQQVCSGVTGHTEAIQVTFDPAIVTLDALLELFWKAHDPTTLNRQGADTGTQYRSGIYTTSETQLKAATASRDKAQEKFSAKIVTEIVPLTKFWKAEDYHQNYFERNPNQAYCRATIPPKLAKLGLAAL
jgi:peptide-methionine (S)-S-oxide reductase